MWLWFGRFLAGLRGWLLFERCRSSWLAGDHWSLKEGEGEERVNRAWIEAVTVMHTQYWIDNDDVIVMSHTFTLGSCG